MGPAYLGRLALAYTLLLLSCHVLVQSVVWYHLVGEEERHSRRIRCIGLRNYSGHDVHRVHGGSEELTIYHSRLF